MMPLFKDKSDEEGQALFEFIIFLPFLIYLFSIMVNVTNAINGSINQQKAVRGYMFNSIKGNAMAPTMEDLLGTYQGGGISTGSAFSIGWKERIEGGVSPYAPCFKFVRFLGSPTNETCDDPSGAEEELKSSYIRVFTFYGLCGATYTKAGSFYQVDDNNKGLGSCTLQ